MFGSVEWYVTYGVRSSLSEEEIVLVMRKAKELLGCKYVDGKRIAPDMIVVEPGDGEEVRFEDYYEFPDGREYPITAVVKLPISRKVYVKADVYGRGERVSVVVMLPDEY